MPKDYAHAPKETCPRCLELRPSSIHTCSPTPAWRRLEEERDACRSALKLMTVAPYASINFDLEMHLYRQRAFSEATFGPGERTKAILEHLRKELVEVEERPKDLSEWIDVAILAFDGAWRAGYTPEQIAAALEAKQTKNEARAWPDWRTAEADKPIEHIREDPTT